MHSVEVIIVGGGPAGAAAAKRLREGGADVLVLDRERFPRLKLCAGWITPKVVADVGLDIGDYPHSFLTFSRLAFNLRGLHRKIPSVQHSIRRVEFDAWLLERSGAAVRQHLVRQVREDGGGFVIDDRYRCRYLIGAGGTRCPVRRELFNASRPRAESLQTVTLELEFAHDWDDADCHLWFFGHGLPGYSWYVPKARGWLNVGVGGMAGRLKERGMTIREHWDQLCRQLLRQFAIRPPVAPAGYSYYLRESARAATSGARIGNAFLTGDAAGLATRDMAEGIGPAIESGQRAADAILRGGPYPLDDVTRASLGGGIVSRCMDWAMTRCV